MILSMLLFFIMRNIIAKDLSLEEYLNHINAVLLPNERDILEICISNSRFESLNQCRQNGFP